MIRIAIAEDEDLWADQLKKYLKRYERENQTEFQITRFFDGAQIGENYSDADIIFMDIEMGYMNGMEAAAKIREKDEQVILIFVTNMAQYALQGYKVNAMDYLLKPVSYVQFFQVLKKAIRTVEKRQDHYLIINMKEGICKISISDILWIESHGHRLTFHTKEMDYETTVYSMKEMEEKLGEMFCRCNSGSLVNLKKVKQAGGGFVMVGEEKISISRGRRDFFMSALVSVMTA